MANPEHLAILKQGVEVWNEWRKKSDEIHIDLREADLKGRQLRGANLGTVHISRDIDGKVDLSGADLHRAQLEDASFYDANLTSAHLSHASLHHAEFLRANLTSANLYRANLDRADLRFTNLQAAYLRDALLMNCNIIEADLSKADLSGAIIGTTTFGNVDLSGVTGLENVRHRAPSTIGIDTIYRSGGKIPEVFLRGCGVPDMFIEFSHSLVGKPIEFYSCFISYSSKDQAFAERLHNDLQNKGVRVWFAPEDLKIGDKFRTRIEEAIRFYDKLLIVLSENSIQSQWVEKELETAFERERQQNRAVLFPIRLDDAVMKTDQAWAADVRRTRHIGDFSRWEDHDSYHTAFERLLRDLKAEGKAPGE